MTKVGKLQDTLYEAHLILERACLISEGAPFWMRADDFAQIVIDGETATLSWPEARSGYYESCDIECQSVTFPSELLLMSVEEIAVWKIGQRKQYDTEQQVKQERETRERAERQTALELQTLAALKKKYGDQS